MNVLEELMAQGFSLRTLSTYPRHVAAEKYHCAALLELTADGRLQQFSSAGYLLDSDEIALLIEKRTGPVFLYKSKEIAADAERMRDYKRFVQELTALLSSQTVE